MPQVDYRVNLEVFSGPLDLLLHLIQEKEVDINDIPVSRIAEEYLRHLEGLDVFNLSWAGEFLVMAATLMEIKSRMLLPEIPGEGEAAAQDDPRADLVRKLLEYRFYKGLALRLRELRRAAASRFGRPRWDLPEGEEEPEPILIEAGIFDLARAFAEVMKETLVDIPQRILYDDVTVQEHIEWIWKRLQTEKSLSFVGLFKERWDRVFVVGVFLALLEMCRRAMIQVEQAALFGEIFIVAREPDPATAPPPGAPADPEPPPADPETIPDVKPQIDMV